MLLKFRIFLLVVGLFLALHILLWTKVNLNKYIKSHAKQENAEITPTAKAKSTTEKIIYEVRLGKIPLGTTTFSRLPAVRVNGKLLEVMVFETNVARFKDKEIIYANPQNLLPIRIERDILNFLLREKITENYNQKNYTLTITKKKFFGNKEDTVIKKDKPIQNAILLPHFVRNMPDLEIGKIIPINLPNRQLEVKLINIEEVTVPAGTFQAYHFESTPKQIEIWISKDAQRIPLKMQGTGPLGYVMLLKEYTP